MWIRLIRGLSSPRSAVRQPVRRSELRPPSRPIPVDPSEPPWFYPWSRAGRSRAGTGPSGPPTSRGSRRTAGLSQARASRLRPMAARPCRAGGACGGCSRPRWSRRGRPGPRGHRGGGRPPARAGRHRPWPSIPSTVPRPCTARRLFRSTETAMRNCRAALAVTAPQRELAAEAGQPRMTLPARPPAATRPWRSRPGPSPAARRSARALGPTPAAAPALFGLPQPIQAPHRLEQRHPRPPIPWIGRHEPLQAPASHPWRSRLYSASSSSGGGRRNPARRGPSARPASRRGRPQSKARPMTNDEDLLLLLDLLGLLRLGSLE